MNPVDALLVIFTVAGLTFLIRYLPFALFSNLARPSAVLADLGRILPPAVIAILVVYCLKTIDFRQTGSFIPQLAAILIVVLLHGWKRNNLLSIGVGTACYMLMVQLIWH
jgi:branched-subunit amino acid transport protein AzlD